MTVSGMYNVDVTPSKRATWRRQWYRRVRSSLVYVTFTPTREGYRCSSENCEESTCKRHGLGFARVNTLNIIYERRSSRQNHSA